MVTKLPRDSDGFIDRQCTGKECSKLFKVRPGTGLDGNQEGFCPYCGHKDDLHSFVTTGQRSFAINNAKHQVRKAFQQDLKDIFGRNRSVTLKLSSNFPPRYGHRELETKIVCPSCDLQYAIYGKFAFCPDCGKHNCAQMLEANLDIVRRQLKLAEASDDSELAQHMIENSLEDAVSAFDGFGRELVRLCAARKSLGTRADGFSMQSLILADQKLQKLFAVSLAAQFEGESFAFSSRMFQVRHLVAHKMGVIDEEYVRKASDPTATVGRKVQVRSEDVHLLVSVLAEAALKLDAALGAAP